MSDTSPHPTPFTEPPLLDAKPYRAPSVFTAASLLAAARQQKGLPLGSVPPICLLDPDGDLVEYLHTTLRAVPCPTWACYHTQLATFTHEGIEYGIVGRAVGAPFAVLVAEELFASGCQLLISITSAGQIVPVGTPPYFVLLDRALRDEGTSYHYLPPAPYSELPPALAARIWEDWDHTRFSLCRGASWTTDAPFRETAQMVAACQEAGILAVEMEAAALYALATVKNYDILCLAHVTNQMGQGETDFEKGAAQGSHTTLQVVSLITRQWLRARPASTGLLHA